MLQARPDSRPRAMIIYMHRHRGTAAPLRSYPTCRLTPRRARRTRWRLQFWAKPRCLRAASKPKGAPATGSASTHAAMKPASGTDDCAALVHHEVVKIAGVAPAGRLSEVALVCAVVDQVRNPFSCWLAARRLGDRAERTSNAVRQRPSGGAPTMHR